MVKLWLFLLPVAVYGEVRTLTLRQAVDLGLKQNPDVALARLDELKASLAVGVARDPFGPHIYLGSGLAKNSGFPMSIDGAAPSVVQARASQAIYNRQQRLLVEQAKENVRGAGVVSAAKRDEIVYRVASFYLDAARLLRSGEVAARQTGEQAKVEEFVRARVAEGRELPLESRKAAVNSAQARRRKERLEADLEYVERSLAVLLGLPAEDRVRAAEEPPAPVTVPASEDAAVESALKSSQELRRLESAIQAKRIEERSQRAARLPRVDLVAQYGLFAKYNNYEDYFRAFQRHNGQLGVSVQVPVFAGTAVAALAARAETEASHLRTELVAARGRVALDARRGFQEIQQARNASEVARLDLDLAREQLSVTLALMQEGRASLRQVEESRFAENEKWIAFYDAQSGLERAKLDLARQTGELTASLR